MGQKGAKGGKEITEPAAIHTVICIPFLIVYTLIEIHVHNLILVILCVDVYVCVDVDVCVCVCVCVCVDEREKVGRHE